MVHTSYPGPGQKFSSILTMGIAAIQKLESRSNVLSSRRLTFLVFAGEQALFSMSSENMFLFLRLILRALGFYDSTHKCRLHSAKVNSSNAPKNESSKPRN